MKTKGKKYGNRRKCNDAQIISTAIRYFGCNFVKARAYLKEVHNFDFPDKSNFNRILHKLANEISSIFFAFGNKLKELNLNLRYMIDSFPVAVCRNIRIPRSKLLGPEVYRGYNSSKKEYFYGFKIQVITTSDGIPVEFFICAGSFYDITAFQSMNIALPKNSELYMDSAYTDYDLEDYYSEFEQIQLMVVRKKNSKRPDSPSLKYLKNTFRKRIETTFSEINAYFPRKIHAVTPQGFMLKIILFIFAYTLDRALTIAT